MTRSEMEAHLEQYYEAAGFSNYREKVLRNASDEEIKNMYECLENETVDRPTKEDETEELKTLEEFE